MELPNVDGNIRYLGIGDYGVSNTPGEVLRTMGLGSCIGVVLLAPHVHAVGLAHIALPSSKTNPRRAKSKPGAYADTAIPALLKVMKEIGVSSASQIVAKLAGGATVVDPNNVFNIGNRNQVMVKRVLDYYRIKVVATELGGDLSRNVSVYVDSGKVELSSAGRGKWWL